MFISVDRRLLRQCFGYAAASAGTALFGAVYEHFSHEVYSYFMLYAFAVPLILGVIPMLGIMLSGKKISEKNPCLHLYGFGIAALTTGSIIKGVLDIYGTTNHLIKWYLYAGIILLVIGAVLILADIMHKKNNP